MQKICARYENVNTVSFYDGSGQPWRVRLGHGPHKRPRRASLQQSAVLKSIYLGPNAFSGPLATEGSFAVWEE